MHWLFLFDRYWRFLSAAEWLFLPGVNKAKNQTVFLSGKAALFLLVGDIPKPLRLAPVTER